MDDTSASPQSNLQRKAKIVIDRNGFEAIETSRNFVLNLDSEPCWLLDDEEEETIVDCQ